MRWLRIRAHSVAAAPPSHLIFSRRRGCQPVRPAQAAGAGRGCAARNMSGGRPRPETIGKR